MTKSVPFLLLALAVTACRGPAPQTAQAPVRLPPGVEAVSLLGQELRAPVLSEGTRRAYEARLEEAMRDLRARPGPDALVWVGRRTAYLGRYREAIGIFSEGVVGYPGDARFLRHRGHRFVTVRELPRAVADLDSAARLVRGRPDEVEPDGLPNARGIPTSTLQSNIFYHLGLAHYLRRDWERARAAYADGMRVSNNPDMLAATTYWLYLTLRRMGRDAQARAALEPIRADLDIIENRSYHRLLLLYKGELTGEAFLASAAGASPLDDATTGYGFGMWHLLEGRRDEALRTFRRVTAGGQWAAFGFIAAEAELAATARGGGRR